MRAEVVSVTVLRPKLIEYLNRVNRLGQQYIVTKNGKPSAVILSFDEWESWKETIEILSNPAAMRRIRKSKNYFDRGSKGKTIKEVFK